MFSIILKNRKDLLLKKIQIGNNVVVKYDGGGTGSSSITYPNQIMWSLEMNGRKFNILNIWFEKLWEFRPFSLTSCL